MMPQILPFVGDVLSGMVGCALCGATLIVAAALCLVDFGLAWLYARPSMGAPLLGGGILCCCLFYVYRRQHRRKNKGLDPYDGVGAGYGALPSTTATAAPPTTVIYGVPAQGAQAVGAVPATGYVTSLPQPPPTQQQQQQQQARVVAYAVPAQQQGFQQQAYQQQAYQQQAYQQEAYQQQQGQAPLQMPGVYQ